MSKQILGPIEKKSLGTYFYPNQKSKAWSSGLWKAFVFYVSGYETEDLFSVKTGPEVLSFHSMQRRPKITKYRKRGATTTADFDERITWTNGFESSRQTGKSVAFGTALSPR